MSTASQRRSAAQMLQNFLRREAAGGVVMLAFTLLALILANSTGAGWYKDFIAMPLALDVGSLTLGMKLDIFVKDVLMAIFFLAVGMELKREMLRGFLSNKGQKTLPLIAALGGVILPALIYLAINYSIPAHRPGWAIPTATDIAFAVCAISLLGKRVPPAAKIFLLAIAIYDDLAAIMIIALVYSSGIVLLPLLAALAVVAFMAVLNRMGVVKLPIYLLLGALLWHFVHDAGIHTTVAGMITGLMIPLGKGKNSPLDRLLEVLHPWVAFGILPLFAFVNAGVNFSGMKLSVLADPLPLGIALGLFFGKQLGIFSATYVAVKSGFAQRPEGASWPVLYGISIVAGIGFTMSLFVGFLAFASAELHQQIKLGVLAGSLLSMVAGMLVLRLATRR